MVGRGWIALWALLALPMAVSAQEVLLPLQHADRPARPHVKSATGAVSLPFFDDFASGALAPSLWQTDGSVAASFDVSPLAPTVGVATLDAIDAMGWLYAAASTETFPADTLVSAPLRLDGLTPADSVVMSFYYLPGGGYGNRWERMGDTPDAGDSLFLDFFRPTDSTWVTVWARGGISVDTLMEHTGTAWQYVAVPLTESAWFDSTFRFRFRNYASLGTTTVAGRAGNCDYWHLDYVMVDRGRDSVASPVWRDLAFAAPAPSMLRLYRAMPYRHYAPQAMASTLMMKIANLYSSPLASQYSFGIYDTMGLELYRYEGGFENAPSQGYQTAPAHARPPVGYAFPTLAAPTDFRVVHTVREGTGGDAYQQNDTIVYTQHFDNYYAYDDGTAENGYGLSSTAAQLYLAYRFDLAVRDTLTAVDCYFNRTLDGQNEAVPFYLTVWRVGSDGRPSEVIYRDETRCFPACDGFAHYVLEAPVVLEDSVFVGFEQSGSDFINIGFDCSLNTSERIFYHTGTEWQQSILSGSLMLRPCFGESSAVGVPQAEVPACRIYPNPASDWVEIEGAETGCEKVLFDLQGRRVVATRGNRLDTRVCQDGLYLLRIVESTGMSVQKVLVKH